MQNKQLAEQIDTILLNCIVQPSSNYTLINKSRAIFASSKEPEIIPEPSDYSFTNRQINDLKALYLQQSKANQKLFEEIMVNNLTGSRISEDACPSLNLLFHIGKFPLILEHIEKNFVHYNQQIYIDELTLLEELLRYEWKTLSIAEFKSLRNWIEMYFQGKNKLGLDRHKWETLYRKVTYILGKIIRQVNIVLTKSLEKEIYSGFNPEINEDEKKLKEEFNKYGFSIDLSESLEKIDQKFFSATDDFDFNGCMQLIRAFTERLFQSIAISLDSTEGKKMDEKDAEEVAKFFIRKGLISKDQGDILISLRHFLSNVGSHRLKSRIEDARLSRNLTTELSLYLIQRLRTIQNE